MAPASAHPSGPLPAVLDIEASGFGRGSYPIEVGYVLPDGASYCALIRPAAHWTHWDPAAEQIHHITRDTLLRHGRSAHDVARQLNERLQGLTLYSDAWAHDYPWLAALFDEAGLVPHFRLDNLRALLSDSEVRDWHPTLRQVTVESALQRHRASSDARLLQATLKRLRPPGAMAVPA